VQSIFHLEPSPLYFPLFPQRKKRKRKKRGEKKKRKENPEEEYSVSVCP
jgi:hypothetical protein